MFNRMIACSLQNRMLVLAGTLLLFVAGGFALQQMSRDVFPEFAPPQVVIQTEAPGLAPKDVEALITYPLESAINGTPGVTDVRSRTSVGLSTIVVVFEANTDIYRDRQLVAERLQNVQGQLPPTAEPPTMLPVTSAVGWLVKYALTSDSVSPLELRTISDWDVAPRILALGGIASVVSIGGEVKQYQVRLDPDRMLAYRISAEQLRTALAGANVNVPGAFLQQPGQEYIVSGVGRVMSLQDIRDTVVTVRENVPITIANVADVALGGAIKRGDGAYGLQDAVIGTVSKAYGADTVTTTEKVERTLEAIKAELPPGVKMEAKVFRQANFIEAALDNLSIALLQGALIVIAVLFLFLANWRASIITFLSMPASFVAGILVLYFFDIGINAMTLGGLAIAIGEVVDDGIITVENVVHRLRLNRNLAHPRPALGVVFNAVREIRNSVVYATLIIVLIFLPIFFLQDLAGRIFTPLGIAYIASVGMSLVVSVTMVPALCYWLLVNREEKRSDTTKTLRAELEDEGDAHFAEHAESGAVYEQETRLVRWMKRHFRRILETVLARFWWITGLAVLALIGAIMLLPHLGRSFLPEFHEGNFIIAMTTLPGTSLDESMRLGSLVRKSLLEYPQVVSISQRAGRSELDEDAQPPNFSEFDVRLDFELDQNTTANELLATIREDLARVPGAVFNIGQFIAHRFDEVESGVRAQVAVKIFGEELPTLYQLGQKVRDITQSVPGAVDVNLEQQISVPQVTIRIDRAKAARYGINVGDIAQDIELLMNGQTVSSILEGRRTFDLNIRLAEDRRNSVQRIRETLIDAPALGENGGKIPLRQVADVQVLDEPYSINRENVQRLIIVAFNVQGRDLGSVISELRGRIGGDLDLPPGYFIQYGGQFESQQAANRTLLSLGLLAIFGALLLLYKAFGSFHEALLVMFNLPLALIGGVLGLFIAGAELSVPAMIGFITLFGIAARNGIILVSHYNQLQHSGQPLREVVVQGTLDRLVPVLMTATTAALGLIPLLWGSPVGKELERPLAQVVLGGLVTATLLNMVVVPTFYYRIERWREKRAHSQSLFQPQETIL